MPKKEIEKRNTNTAIMYGLNKSPYCIMHNVYTLCRQFSKHDRICMSHWHTCILYTHTDTSVHVVILLDILDRDGIESTIYSSD